MSSKHVVEEIAAVRQAKIGLGQAADVARAVLGIHYLDKHIINRA